jgi:hypothetical protein
MTQEQTILAISPLCGDMPSNVTGTDLQTYKVI